MDEHDEFDAMVERLTHDLTAKLVNGEIPMSEAIRVVDTSFSERQLCLHNTYFGSVAPERRLKAKAKVLGALFPFEDVRESAHPTADERTWRLARQIVSEKGCLVVNVRAEGQKPLWEVVRSHLPKGTADEAAKHVWIVALVLGLDGISPLAEHLQRVWEDAQ